MSTAAERRRWFRLVVYEPDRPPPPILCPNGHRIDEHVHITMGGLLTCPKFHGDVQCRATMLVVAGITMPDGSKARLDAEATYDEIADMERRKATLGEMLDHLYNTHPPGRRAGDARSLSPLVARTAQRS